MALPGGFRTLDELFKMLTWKTADELPGLNRTISYISHFINNAWDSLPTTPATGSNPYSQTRTNITGFSPFTVTSPSVFNLCSGGSKTLAAGSSGTSYQWQENNGNGFVNISDGTNYGGTTTQSLSLSSLPTSYAGYQYRCLINAAPGIVYTIKFASTWTGNADQTWNNISNWSCGSIPDGFTDVIIPSGKTNYPVLNSNTTVRSLTAQPGAQITISTGVILDILK